MYTNQIAHWLIGFTECLETHTPNIHVDSVFGSRTSFNCIIIDKHKVLQKYGGVYGESNTIFSSHEIRLAFKIDLSRLVVCCWWSECGAKKIYICWALLHLSELTWNFGKLQPFWIKSKFLSTTSNHKWSVNKYSPKHRHSFFFRTLLNASARISL